MVWLWKNRCTNELYLFTDNYPIEKMFMRHSRLAFSEIIGYKADASLKWLAITGLIPEVRKNANRSQGCVTVLKEWTVWWMMYYFLVVLVDRFTFSFGLIHFSKKVILWTQDFLNLVKISSLKTSCFNKYRYMFNFIFV